MNNLKGNRKGFVIYSDKYYPTVEDTLISLIERQEQLLDGIECLKKSILYTNVISE
jgi:hypothetical protein